jgi:hypothetical protein
MTLSIVAIPALGLNISYGTGDNPESYRHVA